MKNFLFIVLLSLLGAVELSVLTINGYEYSLRQFYDYYPKKQWERADSTQRIEIYSDFIKRELCILEAKKRSLASDPAIAIKIRNRSQQLLVNESYEQLVAAPLINPKDIEEANLFAKKEVFVSHILIGYSDSYLAPPPGRSLDSALLLAQNIKNELLGGERFSDLAEKYSDDPSVSQNSGSIGWVPWGATVPAFQSAAFGLSLDSISEPILTSFGYHLILVTKNRPSDYQFMSDEEYENAVLNLSKRTVRNQLRDAAIAYDSLQLAKHDVFFNSSSILSIIQSYEFEQRGVVGAGGEINISKFLDSVIGADVVCVYGGRGFGVRWFANKIRKLPSSKSLRFDSKNMVLSVFKSIILQDIALNNAHLFGVNNSFSFIQRKKELVSSLLFAAYLEHLEASVPQPDSVAVKQYYNNYLHEKYMGPETVLTREIRVASRGLADSLLALIDVGASFGGLAKKYSLINPEEGGLARPFSNNSNSAFFNAIAHLGVGEVGPVISAPGNQFSLLLLEEKIPGTPLDYTNVYSSILALLLNEGRSIAKKDGVDGLVDKYVINRHLEALIGRVQ